MIKKNDVISTKITNYGCNAEGVAKIDGQIVFLPYTLVGEEVTATIINDKSKFAIAKAISINNKNDARTTAPCPYFTRCGGCQLQHAKYDHALKVKTQIVQDAISNIGKIDFKINNCISSDNEYQYRNKISMPINPSTRKLGMFRTSSHKIVDIEKCELQKPLINKLIQVFNNYLNLSKTSIYDENTKQGTLKHLVAREIDNNLLVTVVINDDDLKDKKLLADLLKQNFESFGLNLNINKQHNNVILSDKFIEVCGLTQIQITENGITYFINNKSFLQVNNYIKNKIYSKVFEEIFNTVVVEGYSGAGLLSAMMAKHAKHVYGIEIIKPATELANLLKSANKISNLTNINGDCQKELPKLINSLNLDNDFYVVVDPPRKGVDKNSLDAICSSKPKKIIYISCNPSTLARDLNIILSSGIYEVSEITPYDMFPQTKHVETLAILKLKI